MLGKELLGGFLGVQRGVLAVCFEEVLDDGTGFPESDASVWVFDAGDAIKARASNKESTIMKRERLGTTEAKACLPVIRIKLGILRILDHDNLIMVNGLEGNSKLFHQNSDFPWVGTCGVTMKDDRLRNHCGEVLLLRSKT